MPHVPTRTDTLDDTLDDTLEDTLEAENRRETLNPPKVVEHLARDLEPDATIVDVGAGTGIFTFEFARALPQASVHALRSYRRPGNRQLPCDGRAAASRQLCH